MKIFQMLPQHTIISMLAYQQVRNCLMLKQCAADHHSWDWPKSIGKLLVISALILEVW